MIQCLWLDSLPNNLQHVFFFLSFDTHISKIFMQLVRQLLGSYGALCEEKNSTMGGRARVENRSSILMIILSLM